MIDIQYYKKLKIKKEAKNKYKMFYTKLFSKTSASPSLFKCKLIRSNRILGNKDFLIQKRLEPVEKILAVFYQIFDSRK